MPTIVFFLPPAAGAIHASLKLARNLREAGYHVQYAGLPDCEAYILPHGFPFVPFFENWFPKGYAAASWSPPTGNWWSRFNALRQRAVFADRFCRWLIESGPTAFQKSIATIGPSVCIIGSAYFESTLWGLLAYSAGIPALYLNSSFVGPEDPATPPIQTSLIPDGTFAKRQQIRIAWKTLLLRKRLSERLSAVLRTGVDWTRQIRLLADACGYPATLLNYRDTVAPRLAVPELVLWPQAFDFARTPDTSRHYIEPSIDTGRTEVSFVWERLDPTRKLIYCSFGSLPFLSQDHYRRFFRSVVDAVASNRDWQLVLATGGVIATSEIGVGPREAIVVERAPQLALLARAHAAITHGGANTVKECIFFGVPMVVFPMGFDPNGIAARVVHHGIGVTCSFRKASAPQIRSLLNTIDTDPSYRQRIREWSKRFGEVEISGAGVRAVEAILYEGNGTPLRRPHKEPPLPH